MTSLEDIVKLKGILQDFLVTVAPKSVTILCFIHTKYVWFYIKDDGQHSVCAIKVKLT